MELLCCTEIAIIRIDNKTESTTDNNKIIVGLS